MRKAKNSTEVLKAVEWILTNIGWTQHASYRNKHGDVIGSCIDLRLPKHFHSSLGTACLAGAIGLVNAPDSLKERAIVRISKAAKGKSPMEFNDDCGRTKKQVINIIRKALQVK